MAAAPVTIYEKGYLKQTPRRHNQRNIAIRIDINSIPGIDLIRLSDRKETYEIEITGMNLPEYVLNADPTMPTIKFVAMLLRMEHRFTYMGKKLDYNGWDDDTGMPLFCLVENGKRINIRIHRTDEYKCFMLKKIIHTLMLYLGTPTPLERAAEMSNISDHVAWEAVRWLKEPRRIVIDGEKMIVEHNGRKFLVVHMDGTRGGGKGIVVAICGKQRKYFRGNENSDDVLEEVIADITKEGDDLGVDAYLIIIDGNPKVAEFILDKFGEKVVLVEHSHSNWWEVCIIYKHGGNWYTVRMRSDMFVEERRDDPKIDIPPGHIEVWEGIVHAGYAGRSKRKILIAESVRNEMEKLLSMDIVQGNPNVRAFRAMLAWYVKRLNQLARALKAHGIDTSHYVDRLMEAFKHLVSWARRQKKKKDHIKAICWALGKLQGDFAPVREKFKFLMDNGQRGTRVKKKSRQKRRKKASRRRQKIRQIYAGDPSHAPSHARDKVELLRKVFDGKHITNNPLESEIGIYVHLSRTFRGSGKILLRLMLIRSPIPRVVAFIVENLRFGRGPRGLDVRLRPGNFYLIRYRDSRGCETERFVRVERIVGEYVRAYCYLRGDCRVFRRDRILEVYRVYPARSL